MKSQQELYHALEKVEGIIRDNRLFETLQAETVGNSGRRQDRKGREQNPRSGT